MKYLVSLSAGKDSTACLLWALDNLPKEDIVVYYIDTKWEHEDVYTYLEYLKEKLDIEITVIESIGMVEMAKKKRMMPNPTMRFCTEYLKIKPALEFYKKFQDDGVDFINIVGIRREESKKRANTESFFITDKGIKTLAPVAYWDTQRVFDFHKEHGIEVNPLYKRGVSRVGCYPCIYARKHDLQNMEPKYKERLRNLEKEISDINGKEAKFFTPAKERYLRDTLDFGSEYAEQCVNQYSICS